VADLFLRPAPGRAGADIAAIGADRALVGPVSRPKPPLVSASQLMGYRFRENCSGPTNDAEEIRFDAE